MASLKAMLGMFPKTSQYEADRIALQEEYDAFRQFAESQELKEYLELKDKVNSSEFVQRKNQIRSQKFSDTEEYRKEREYLQLKKAKDIKLYFKTKASGSYKNYLEVEGSEELKEFENLSEFLKSPDFLKIKEYSAQSPRKKFEQSELFNTLKQYEEQKNSSRIRNYYKFKKLRGYHYFKEAENSRQLEEYRELEKFAGSDEYFKARNTLSKSDFKRSDEFAKYQQFRTLSKAKEIKNYLKLLDSPYYNDFDEIRNSKELEAFKELEKYIQSVEFKNEKQKIEKQKFEDTEEYLIEKEFNRLKQTGKFQQYFKFKKSKEFANMNQLENSERLQHYEELGVFVQSEAFKKVKDFMALPAAKKYETSDEYALEQRYLTLEKSEKITTYFKQLKSDKFSELKKWELTFEEDFTANKLDRKKWITRYFWGNALLKESYALSHEKHFFTDGDNLEFDDTALRIVTRKEKATGKAWNPTVGFFPKEFNYTSGLISTGNSFRQRYGTFEAKIRLSSSYPVNHAFWMISEKIVPHIDIMKADKKLSMNAYWGNPDEKNGIRKKISNLKRARFTNDYFIYSLEWLENTLTWKINGVTVATSTTGIPREPMYLLLSSGLYKDTNGTTLPAELAIDWVRCYQKKAE